MLVKDVMSKKPEYLAPDSTLQKAAEEMFRQDFGIIPIGENDRLVGMVSDRDIALRAVAKGKDPKSTSVKEVMSKKVLYCFEDDDIASAVNNMCKQQIRRLVVLNKDKRMTGMLSVADIVTKSNDDKLCSKLIKAVSAKTH